MRNIKDQIVEALDSEFGEDHVTDEFPQAWEVLPVVQVTEENNKIYESCDMSSGIIETKSQVRYRIDIWSNENLSAPAMAVDNSIGISGIGLYRTECKDAPDLSGKKHKVMRYEGIINSDNDFIEWYQ